MVQVYKMSSIFKVLCDSRIKIFISGAVCGTSIYILLTKMYDNYRKPEKILDDVEKPNQSLLFSPGKINMNICLKKNNKICDRFSCSLCSCKKFFSHISKAKSSLHICVYLITYSDLSDIILKLFKRGVSVKIIMDKQMSDEAHQSKYHVFLQNNVPIMLIDAPDLMHNKFVIIDNKKVIFGSFNWTLHALRNNYESGAIINDTDIVNDFSKYFDLLWNDLKHSTENNS